jgi:hypothetical protein
MTWYRAAAAAIIAAGLLAGCGAPAVQGGPGAGHPVPAGFAPGPGRSWPAWPAAGSPGSARVVPVPPAHGGQPQTRALPRAATAAFRAELTDLWAAVVSGRPADARPAFFPLRAYRRVKAIPGPAADWHTRLWAGFRLDVAAAHRLLGRRAATARLIRVIVPAQAAWVSPGGCANRIGYWHVTGARVLYRSGGRLRSFGIASLISWRGRWFVVHFGAVLRTAPVGVVDQPATGPGRPGPPGGC